MKPSFAYEDRAEDERRGDASKCLYWGDYDESTFLGR